MSKKAWPIFDKRLFWDVDFDKIDYDAKAAWVIVRVFERGDVPDIRNCRRYYGDDKIAEVVLNAKFIMEHAMHLASAIIEKPVQEFRCYKLKQSTLAHSPY